MLNPPPSQGRWAVLLLWVSLAAGIVLTLLETAPNEALEEPWMEWLTWGSFAFAYAIMAMDAVALYWLFSGAGAAWFARPR